MAQKGKIPRAIREQVWLKHVGKKFETKCTVKWCKNIITPFEFTCGHNIPESKGGTITLGNLYPICSRCNLSMGDRYTIREWDKLCTPVPLWRQCISRFFLNKKKVKDSQ